MGFLSPAFLLAAAALAVPLFLHLFHRYRSQKVVFPALRYLLRTEREHARRIRLRQLLLLLVRCLAVLALVLTGARLFVRGGGGAHLPTALVLILDNSASTGRVVGEVRVLDELKELALASLELATAQDRIWVLRAGEPWQAAVPEDPAAARRRVRETEVSGAREDLARTLARARSLVQDSELPAKEIQLLSDLQASAFDTDPVVSDTVPTVAFTGVEPDTTNRYLRTVTAGGGLPPLAGRRFDVVVELGGAPDDTASSTVRLTLDGQVRAATVLRPGASAVLTVGPFPTGAVTGHAEADPDPLRADDRRYLAFSVRPPPSVAIRGSSSGFLDDALAVLAAGGRVTPAADADVLISMGGVGLVESRAPRRLVVPPADAALLPALNRGLADAGVPWRYEEATPSGELRAGTVDLPVDLADVRVTRRYRLVPTGDVPGARTLASLSDGTPFLVTGRGTTGDHLLLATPLDPGFTTLPVDAAMIPLLEWALSGWDAGTRSAGHLTGDPLPLPAGATDMVLPDGTRVPADGTRQLAMTRDPGIYTILQGDSVLARVAVNVSPRESLLAPVTEAALREHLGEGAVFAESPGEWRRRTFTSRQGHELWRPLLLAALALLLVESWMAATKTAGSASERNPKPAPVPDPSSASHA